MHVKSKCLCADACIGSRTLSTDACGIYFIVEIIWKWYLGMVVLNAMQTSYNAQSQN